MIDLVKTKKTYFVILAVLFVFVSLSETTYSLFLKSESTEDFSYNTGLLDLQFIEDEPINLENVFPVNDSEGINYKPYKLTIKNTGSLIYLFNLKMISESSTNTIDSKYIKVKVNDENPHTLFSTDNVIASNIIIYPNEEITFDINVWLDINTPNNELGKTFTAKVVTTGSGIYKTSDSSGANHPKLYDGMIPVYYDETSKVWKKADKSNTIDSYNWYNYDAKKWANSIVIKKSEKQIYDLSNRNNLKVSDITFNNGNVVIDDKYLDLNIKGYTYSTLSNVIRVKFDEFDDNNYLVSNDIISLYYNSNDKTFNLKSNTGMVTSKPVEIAKNNWYIVVYTFDGNNASIYLNGENIANTNLSGSLYSSSSFKLGTDNTFKEVSKVTIGDVLFYNRILTNNEITLNYKTSMNIIYDGLYSGYNNFRPMTLSEYYLSGNMGMVINNDDILTSYVWIPRFKYKVWNVLGENNVDTYDAYHHGIDISFENLTASSGTIYCENADCYSDNLKTTKVTNADNGKYYTHSAFSNTNEELTGLWVSKYEVSSNNESKFANQVSTGKKLSDYYSSIKKISDTTDYHVIKNTEWGAIAYLTHSKYGLCNGNECTVMSKNSTLISGSDAFDSSTGNIYGIFDLNGSANEYTMGNISADNSLNLTASFFKDVPIGTDDYDLYGINSFILGDATKELSINGSNWYDGIASMNSNNNWIIRSSLYGYETSLDIESDNLTTRIVTK